MLRSSCSRTPPFVQFPRFRLISSSKQRLSLLYNPSATLHRIHGLHDPTGARDQAASLHSEYRGHTSRYGTRKAMCISNTRTYAEAIAALNDTQSNAATLDAVRASGGRLSQFAIPEMIEYLYRIGYKVIASLHFFLCPTRHFICHIIVYLCFAGAVFHTFTDTHTTASQKISISSTLYMSLERRERVLHARSWIQYSDKNVPISKSVRGPVSVHFLMARPHDITCLAMSRFVHLTPPCCCA
jgi:hypothetical protein